MKKYKESEALKVMRREVKRLQSERQQIAEAAFSRGYNEGRAHVTNVLRELLGIEKL